MNSHLELDARKRSHVHGPPGQLQSLADLQWLGHKHASSTRHHAAILQRTLVGAYKRADYFARNVRTIQVLIDREAILTGAAAGGEPWKFYDLGDGYCSPLPGRRPRPIAQPPRRSLPAGRRRSR